MKVVIRLSAKQELKALPILLRHSPGTILPERTYVLEEEAALTLREKGVRCSEVQEARWGSVTKIALPGGGEVGLYQPKNPIAMARTSN